MKFEKCGIYDILLIIGGILFAYLGYFVYPEYFGTSAGFAGIIALIAPLLLIFLGIIITYGANKK